MTGTQQLPLGFSHRPALGREDFLVADCNADAVAWIDRWPDWPSPALAVYGPPGCGKTHIAHVWQARSGARFVTPERLAQATPPDILGAAAACVIDGAGGPFDETALLHLYNLLRERGGHLLLTACAPPARWAIRLPDLRSRLAAAPAVAVGAPDDGLIGAVMVKLFADRQLRIGEDVITFLLSRMERSFAAARAIVAALDEAALADRRNITVPLARDVLRRVEETTVEEQR